MTGFVFTLLLTLNHHIVAGVEDGKVAAPTQVLQHSARILVADGVILVAAHRSPSSS